MRKSSFFSILTIAVVVLGLSVLADWGLGAGRRPGAGGPRALILGWYEPEGGVGKLAAPGLTNNGRKGEIHSRDAAPPTPIAQAPLEVQVFLGALVVLFGLLAVVPLFIEKGEN